LSSIDNLISDIMIARMLKATRERERMQDADRRDLGHVLRA
jgi:hypothetical protein